MTFIEKLSRWTHNQRTPIVGHKTILSFPECVKSEFWPKFPDDKAFIWEAINIVGAAKYGDEWTGEELQTFYWPMSPIDRGVQIYKDKLKKDRVPKKRQQPIDGNTMLENIRLADEKDKKDTQQFRDSYAIKPEVIASQSMWKLNTASYERLSWCCSWIGKQARNSNIKTFTTVPANQMVNDMKPQAWVVTSELLERIARAGFVVRYQNGTKLHSLILVDREDLEREVKLLKHGGESISSQDIAGLSPYLRFAINIAQTRNFVGSNAAGFTREALAATLIEQWDDAVMGSRLSPTMAERLSFVIRHP